MDHIIELVASGGLYTATWIAGIKPLAEISYFEAKRPEEIVDIFVQLFHRQGYEPTGLVVVREFRGKKNNG